MPRYAIALFENGTRCRELVETAADDDAAISLALDHMDREPRLTLALVDALSESGLLQHVASIYDAPLSGTACHG